MSPALDRAHFRGVLLRAVLVPLLLVAVIGAGLAWQIEDLVHASARVRRMDAFIEEGRHVYRRMVDVETGLRGYLLTGEPAFLAPYDDARAALPRLVEVLAGLVAADEGEARQVDGIRAAYADFARYAEGMIAIRRAGGAYAAVAANLRGKEKMDALRARIESLIDENTQRRSGAVLAAERSGTRTLWAASGLTVLLGVLLGLYVRRQMLAVSSSYAHALEEVAAANRTLEQRVEERTARLTEANREMEAFSYSVSHDLRAPLRSVQGLASILLEDYGEGLDPEARGYAVRIADSASRMDALIQDLLRYSRLSRAELPTSCVPLRRAVDDALAQLDEAARAGVVVQDPLPEVRAHKGTLVQVLVNLLSNALKFVPPGRRPVVRVSAERRGDRVRVLVRDEGIGVAPEHHDRIFRVFERLHGAETYPGTGIGLAIVRKGVERMGGQVGVTSEPGEGSTFWFELPEGNCHG